MGLLSSWTSNRDRDRYAFEAGRLVIDLTGFQVGSTPLGEPPSVDDGFAEVLKNSELFESPAEGVELGTSDGVLDHAFLTLEKFAGEFQVSGSSVAIDPSTSEQAIRHLFGEPYWIDRDDDETIYFYEYQTGAVELQFEFVEGGRLGFITLCRNGVLSTPEQRKTYGVDKAWPPED